MLAIIRGYYLTATGQEPTAYYFKIVDGHLDFEVIQSGDVAVTLYQNQDTVTSLPAFIRVDKVYRKLEDIERYLMSELEDDFPLLPIVRVYNQLDPIVYKELMTVFDDFHSELKQFVERKNNKEVIHANNF